jgi:uncharacterized YigZ family protein
MINSYLTLKDPVTGRITRKGSRFIGLLYPVPSKDEITAVLKEVRRHYHDATHRCYAYRLMGESGPIVSTDDAGEPAGAAGGPILQQVEIAQLYDVLAVVVRYFGGKKLGLGGLIRAYADATKEALNGATFVEQRRTIKLAVTFPAKITAGIMGLIHRHPAAIEEVTYDHEAHVLLSLPPSLLKQFVQDLQETSRAQARWKEVR